MEPSLLNLNKSAATNGLILGVLSFVLSLMVYYVSPSSMGSTSFGLGMIVLSLVLYVVFTIDLRKKIGGFWSFKEALKGIFLMMFIAGLVDALLKGVFYKFIEPDAYAKISGYVIDNLNHTYENMGMSQDQIDPIIEKVKESLKGQFNPGIVDFLKTLGILAIIEFICALIFAAIFKKEQPMFATVEEE